MSLGEKLPVVNAFLNGTAFVLLLCGFVAIRNRKIDLHKKLMGSAFVVSCVFLVSYLTRFYLTGAHRYPGTGWLRTVYLTILLTHTVLAATVPVLAIISIRLALKNKIEKHRRVSRWTLPIWMYVSATGVVIYFMLYRF